MFKSKLQEVCQKKAWALPEYSSTKEGVDHDPSFSASVLVNGLTFHTPQSFRSSKLAQNDAARLAFEHFSAAAPLPVSRPAPSTFPQPSLIAGLPVGSQISDNTTVVGSQNSGSTLSDNYSKDVQHHKNQLQYYAQKRNLNLPVYSCEREGPPHAARFKCTVTIDGQTYQGQEFLPTVKDAEHAAAKVALIFLLPNGVQEDDTGLYKNLLQELLQKEGQHVPLYSTTTSGEPHMPRFVSTVEIGGEYFTVSGRLYCSSCGNIQDHDNYDGVSDTTGTFIRLGISGQGTNYHYRDTKIYEANKLIDDVTLRLNLSPSRADEIKAMISKITEDEFNQGKWFNVLIGACAYVVTRRDSKSMPSSHLLSLSRHV
ncbi:hypothetical protein ACLB2K_055780 [Fragaria x ananassa]